MKKPDKPRQSIQWKFVQTIPPPRVVLLQKFVRQVITNDSVDEGLLPALSSVVIDIQQQSI